MIDEKIYIITYDLLQTQHDTTDYATINGAIERTWNETHKICTTTFIVKTKANSAKEVFDAISGYFRTGDKLFVAEIAERNNMYYEAGSMSATVSNMFTSEPKELEEAIASFFSSVR